MASPPFFTQPTGVSNEPDIKKPVRDKQDIRDTISRRLNDKNRYGIISGRHAESSILTMPLVIGIAVYSPGLPTPTNSEPTKVL